MKPTSGLMSLPLEWWGPGVSLRVLFLLLVFEMPFNVSLLAKKNHTVTAKSNVAKIFNPIVSKNLSCSQW